MAESREDNAEFSFDSAVRGYHVHRRVAATSRTASKGKINRERGSAEDRFAIAIRASDTATADNDPIVGHLP